MKLEIAKWEIMETVTVLANEWLRVRQDTCRLPDDTVIDDYFVVEKPDIVTVFPLTLSGEVVLVRQYKHGIKKVLLELPGGYIDEGESPAHAAARELAEETGFSTERLKHIGTLANDPASLTNLIYVFFAKGVSKATSQRLDAHENMQVELVNLHEVLELILQGTIRTQCSVASTFLALSTCLGLDYLQQTSDALFTKLALGKL
jgi:ADP-ribose pyrophosphatase